MQFALPRPRGFIRDDVGVPELQQRLLVRAGRGVVSHAFDDTARTHQRTVVVS